MSLHAREEYLIQSKKLDKRSYKFPKVEESLCIECHNEEHDEEFDFESDLLKIKHTQYLGNPVEAFKASDPSELKKKAQTVIPKKTTP